MAFAGAQGRWAFYRYVEDHQSDTLCNHLNGPVSLDTDQYARVLPIMDMIEYYLRKPLMLPPLTYEAEQEVLERFFTLPPDKRETLGVVTEVWRGRMLNVWITSKSLLDTSLAGLSENETANVLRDRLGFSGLDSGKLLGIVYPRRFDRVETYVPTSLDSHSGSLFYVSTDGSDRWGLTCGLEASIEGLRERVHQAFDGGLTDQFAMKLFGEITKPAAPDPTHLLNEALTRAS
jgi:hypothetical protein